MIIVAIGANLSQGSRTPRESCEAACRRLASADLVLDQVSPWYESAAIPVSDQPAYVNGIAILRGAADPAELLARLHAIEAEFGRVRGVTNASRTLDLDLIAIGGLVRDRPDPVLPHPRMHERAFVLRPLRDIAPDWRHPRLGLTAGALLDRLTPQAIRRL